MRQLWQYTHPQSLTYAFMQDPLLSEEVLLGLGSRRTAEDGARPASRRPRRLPGPEGTEGTVVHAGPRRTGDPEERARIPRARKALIQHMLRISAQAQILSHRPGSSRSSAAVCPSSISPGLRAEAAAVRRQQKAKDAVQALLPIGIGAEGGNFNKIYLDTFTRIVRNGENIQTVLNEQGALLQAIFDKTGAPCWAPDPPSGKAPVQGEVRTPRLDQERRWRHDRSAGDRLTRRRRRWEGLLPYWLILPTVAYLGLFFVWPMIQGFGLAFRDETGNWTFERVRHDGQRRGLRRGAELHVPPDRRDRARSSSCSRSAMALLLNARLRGGGLFLYIFLLPLAISDLAAGHRLVGDLHGARLPEHDPRRRRGDRSAVHLPRPDRRRRSSSSPSSPPRSGGRRRS